MKRLIQKHIQEVCQDMDLEEEIILHFIQEEWVIPFDEKEMIFDDEDLARIHLIHELQEDLGVNDEAIPIILNLLDQLNLLRSHIKKLKPS
jgi:chaperone modulatory protein CbpM